MAAETEGLCKINNLMCNFLLKIYVQFNVYEHICFFLVGLMGTHNFQIFNRVQSSEERKI